MLSAENFQLTERDYRELKLSAINPHDRCTWRSGVRSAMRAESQLSGRGPTDVDFAPVPARNLKSGPSCSKLMTSLVNDSLKFTSSDTQIC